MDPISIGLGLFNAGMGALGGMASNQAQAQDFVNQKAFQSANSRFASWQASFNARTTDANAQYKYWADTVNYNQQLAYTNSLRNFELIKSVRQAEIVGQTRAAAGAAYVQDSDALSQAYQETSMQEAVSMQQYRWRALQARASVQAMGQEGQSVDRIVNDYARQEGDYQSLMQINQKLRTRQYSREQAAQVAQYLSRWNSQQFYEEQPYIDPIAPFAPLPTLMTPPPPSMTGRVGSAGATALNIGTSILGGIQTSLAMESQVRGLRTPSAGTGSGTPGGR